MTDGNPSPSAAPTDLIFLNSRTVIPGLIASHSPPHLKRGGLHYSLKLRWDGVPTCKGYNS